MPVIFEGLALVGHELNWDGETLRQTSTQGSSENYLKLKMLFLQCQTQIYQQKDGEEELMRKIS